MIVQEEEYMQDWWFKGVGVLYIVSVVLTPIVQGAKH